MRATRASLLAGGTDLLVNVRAGLAHPKVVVDTKKVEDFAGIAWSERDGLVIRAGATINAVLDDAKIRSDYPLLIACAHDLASHQIRNRATVVGNVVNASPCADMSPALLCLRAHAVIGSKGGEREVPFSAFFKGVKRTAVAHERSGRAHRRSRRVGGRARRLLQAQADQRPRSRHRQRRAVHRTRRGDALDGRLVRPDPGADRGARRFAPGRRGGRRGLGGDQPDQRRAGDQGISRCTWSKAYVRRLLDEVRS